MVLAMVFFFTVLFRMPFIRLRMFPSIPSVLNERLYHVGAEFYQMFYAHIDIIMWFYFFVMLVL